MSRVNLGLRVRQFEMMELPGQPRIMHMGTANLVTDLWHEIERLETIINIQADSIAVQQNAMSSLRRDRDQQTDSSSTIRSQEKP